MGKADKEFLENPRDLRITYGGKEVKIGDLTEDEKTDCISKLWHYKGVIEDEKEVLQEMIQKMYFLGKMEKLEEEDS